MCTSPAISRISVGRVNDVLEQYPVYAASALAANSFARSSFAAAFPYVRPMTRRMPYFANSCFLSLFGVQMYNSKSGMFLLLQKSGH